MQQPLSQAYPGTLVFTFGASGILAQQIRNGAPYDVYLSANEAFVKQLAARGNLLPDSVRVYAYGRLGLWSKSLKLNGLNDLVAAGVKHLAIPNPVHAPYGAAAKAMLQRQELWQKLEPKIAYGENVEQTLQYAESGNADAAITAYSVLLGRNAVLLPASLYPPIVQSGGIVASSRNVQAARRFLEFLSGPQGKALLSRFGLAAPPPDQAPVKKTRR